MDPNPLVSIPASLGALVAIPLAVLGVIAVERRVSGLATHRSVYAAVAVLAALVLGAIIVASVAARVT